MIIHQLQKKAHFTSQEELIANYILAHPETILNDNAKELAQNIYTSSSTIVRFCKKLGYTGYPAFQRQFTLEYSTKKQYSEKILLSNVTTDKAPDVLDNLYQYVIQETRLMLNKDILSKVVKTLSNAQKIDFYGCDSNYLAIQKICHQLDSIYIPAQAYNSINNTYINELKGDQCVSIIISHSGNNPAMLRIAHELKKHGITTIAITNASEPTLSSICDESLFIYTSDEHTRIGSMQWTISVNFMLDLLFISLLNYYKKVK